MRYGELAGLDGEFAPLKASEYATVLISSETLDLLNRDSVKQLRVLTSGCDVTIVYYMRRWTELLLSAWMGSIKRGETRALPDRLAPQLAAPVRRPGQPPDD